MGGMILSMFYGYNEVSPSKSREFSWGETGPTEVFVHRAFRSVSGHGGIDPLSAWQPGQSQWRGWDRVGFDQIKFTSAFSVFVYKILLAVIAFDYVPGFYVFISNDLF